MAWHVVERRDAMKRRRERRDWNFVSGWAVVALGVAALVFAVSAVLRGCAVEGVVYPDPVCEWCGEVMGEEWRTVWGGCWRSIW